MEQRLDIFQVAIPGRIMDLTTEGEAAPSHCDQHDDGAAGYWGMAKSAKESIHDCSRWLVAKSMPWFPYDSFLAAMLGQQFHHGFLVITNRIVQRRPALLCSVLPSALLASSNCATSSGPLEPIAKPGCNLNSEGFRPKSPI
jgi:hypothetical protein